MIKEDFIRDIVCNVWAGFKIKGSNFLSFGMSLSQIMKQ